MSAPAGPGRDAVRRDLDWMADGTRLFLDTLDGVPDSDLAGASRLPGWSRSTVAAHVARNADALRRLLTWARTGVETPMYDGPEHRDSEIRTTATAAPRALRADVASSAASLADDLASLPDHGWTTPLRSAQGRAITATQVPWMRVREVWLHAVDLDAGAGAADLPPDLVDALLDDVTASISRRAACPAVVLRPDDREREWRLSPQAASQREAVVEGVPAAEVLAWLIGRGDHSERLASALPSVPRWL